MSATLWLARHARPLVDAGVCYGRLDVAADADATRAAARALATRLPAAARIVVSPLRRCRQLADALQGLRPACAARTEPRIAEMDFGAWEGRTWNAIGAAAIGAWTGDFARHAPGGGETVDAFLARVAAALDEARLSPAEPTLWITHAGVARAVDLLLAGRRTVEDAADWPRGAPAFGTWVERNLSDPRRPAT